VVCASSPPRIIPLTPPRSWMFHEQAKSSTDPLTDIAPDPATPLLSNKTTSRSRLRLTSPSRLSDRSQGGRLGLPSRHSQATSNRTMRLGRVLGRSERRLDALAHLVEVVERLLEPASAGRGDTSMSATPSRSLLHRVNVECGARSVSRIAELWARAPSMGRVLGLGRTARFRVPPALSASGLTTPLPLASIALATETFVCCRAIGDDPCGKLSPRAAR
jgi:hypothetical protein